MSETIEISEEDRKRLKRRGLFLAFKEAVDTVVNFPEYLDTQSRIAVEFRIMMEEVWKEVYGKAPK